MTTFGNPVLAPPRQNVVPLGMTDPVALAQLPGVPAIIMRAACCKCEQPFQLHIQSQRAALSAAQQTAMCGPCIQDTHRAKSKYKQSQLFFTECLACDSMHGFAAHDFATVLNGPRSGRCLPCFGRLTSRKGVARPDVGKAVSAPVTPVKRPGVGSARNPFDLSDEGKRPASAKASSAVLIDDSSDDDKPLVAKSRRLKATTVVSDDWDNEETAAQLKAAIEESERTYNEDLMGSAAGPSGQFVSKTPSRFKLTANGIEDNSDSADKTSPLVTATVLNATTETEVEDSDA